MAEIGGGNMNWVDGGGGGNMNWVDGGGGGGGGGGVDLRVVGVLWFLGYLMSHDGKSTVVCGVCDELFNVQIISHRLEIVVD